MDEFDQLFSRPVVKPRAKKDSKKDEDANKKAKKVTAAKYLDPKKSQVSTTVTIPSNSTAKLPIKVPPINYSTFPPQDMAIFIRSNHLEIAEVESAIYNLDNSVIDFETLQSIGKKRVRRYQALTFDNSLCMIVHSPGHAVRRGDVHDPRPRRAGTGGAPAGRARAIHAGE